MAQCDQAESARCQSKKDIEMQLSTRCPSSIYVKMLLNHDLHSSCSFRINRERKGKTPAQPGAVPAACFQYLLGTKGILVTSASLLFPLTTTPSFVPAL